MLFYFQTQMKIDQFFNQVTVYCDNVKVKSKRIQRVLKPPGNQLSSGKGGKKDKNKSIKNRNPKADKVPRKITNEKQFKNKKRPYSTELNRNKLKSEAAVIQSKVPKKEWWWRVRYINLQNSLTSEKIPLLEM